MIRKHTAAQYLERMMELSGKSQKEIADLVGLKKANMLTMMKQGVSKIPVYRVGALAKACGSDPARFLEVVMSEYEPETWKVIKDNTAGFLTEDEQKALAEYRAKRDADLEVSE